MTQPSLLPCKALCCWKRVLVCARQISTGSTVTTVRGNWRGLRRSCERVDIAGEESGARMHWIDNPGRELGESIRSKQEVALVLNMQVRRKAVT